MATTSPIDQLNFDDCNLVPPPEPPPKQPNKFVAVLGKVASAAGSVFMPGLGGIAGIAGKMLGGATSSDPTQYLLLQERIQQESREYEAVSSVLKAKHDAAMDCLRNISH